MESCFAWATNVFEETSAPSTGRQRGAEMTVFHYPGGLRVGVRREDMNHTTPRRRKIAETRMLLMVILNGHQRLSYAQHCHTFSCVGPQGTDPKAIFIDLEAGQEIVYLESLGAPVIKISVSFDPEWLATAGSLIEEPSCPDLQRVEVSTLPSALTHKVWTLDAEMTAIAQDILHLHTALEAGQQSRHSVNLALMSRGVELLRAALAQTGMMRAAAPTLAPDPRLARLTSYIATHLDRSDWGPEELAGACGLGLRSLQRLCRTAFDCSPSQFIRNQRLEASFAALSHSRINVQQAAHLAGYSSTANFSTAFKRRFGVPPSHLHARPG